MFPAKEIAILILLCHESHEHTNKFAKVNVDPGTWNDMGFSLQYAM